MDKKITELNDIRNISKSEYIAVANSAETCKLKLSDLQKAIVNVDNTLSENSKNSIQNGVVTKQINAILKRLEALEHKEDKVINLKVAETYTSTVESNQPANVEITDTGITDNTKKLVFKFFIPKGEKGESGEVGEKGTGLQIMGKYNSYEELEIAWKNGILSGNNPPKEGDSYLINGELWVFDGDDFTNCGEIKGPQGEQGESAYVHIKYAEYLDPEGNGVFTADTGDGLGETPGKYVGVLVDNNEEDSPNPADYKWSRFTGNDGFGYEYIFKRSTEFTAPTIPTDSEQINGYTPEGWTDDPTGVDATNKYEWCCYRKSDEEGVWGPWRGKKRESTKAWLFAMYAESVGVPGATGSQGPILYPAGEWESGTYKQTLNLDEIATSTPYVLHGNDHYVLIVESTTEEPGKGSDWLLMERFSALYTDILLADKATVGNACFYGQYMFSQGGTGQLSTFDGTVTNPYKAEGFKPAWCVNLITGEMWAGTGSSYFAADGSGYVANGNITWGTDQNVIEDSYDNYGEIQDGSVIELPELLTNNTKTILVPYTALSRMAIRFELKSSTAVLFVWGYADGSQGTSEGTSQYIYPTVSGYGYFLLCGIKSTWFIKEITVYDLDKE